MLRWAHLLAMRRISCANQRVRGGEAASLGCSGAATDLPDSAGGDDAIALQPRTGLITNCHASCATVRSCPAEIVGHVGGNGGQHHVMKLCRGEIKRRLTPLQRHAGLVEAQHDERRVPRAFG